jgi:hypothetical protein
MPASKKFSTPAASLASTNLRKISETNVTLWSASARAFLADEAAPRVLSILADPRF